MKRLIKILIALIILTAFVAVTGFFILPAVLKPILIDKISSTLHRSASIEQIKINPFALSVTICGFQLTDPEKEVPFISFRELYINADLPTSIIRRAVIVEEIRLDTPYIGLTRLPDGTYNFSDLLPQEKAESQQEPSRPLLFSLNNIQITHGSIDFHDLPNKTDHTVRELTISAPFVSNIGYYMKNYVEPKFSAVINGHQVDVTGQTQPFRNSRETRIDIDMRDIDLPFYLQYAPVRLNFKLTEAKLDTQLQMSFVMPEGKSPELKLSGRLLLKKLAIDDLHGKKILRMPMLEVDLASIEPFIPKVHLSQVALEAPQLIIRRDKKGKIDVLQLIEKDQQEKSGKSAPKENQAPPAAGRKALILTVDRMHIEKADVAFIDAKPAEPVSLSINPLNLTVLNFSLQKGHLSDVDLSMMVNRKADIRTKGKFGTEPLAAHLAVDVKNLFIRPFQPYFTEAVRLDVTHGFISTAGTFTLSADAQNNPDIKYEGQLAIHHLATIDKANAHDFLKWKQLNFQSLAVGNHPPFVNIGEISLSDFFAKIVIHPGGVTNIQDIFVVRGADTAPEPAAEKSQAAKAAEPPPDIKIGRVRFQGGVVDFADHNIKPSYAVTMLQLKGSITGLSSQEISRATMNLKGNLGYGSPIDINGTVNPLTKDLFADIKINFKDIDMTPVTPYAIKYLGYPITKGKLTFHVSYLVDKRKLDAENKIFFDQLTFGEQVESPEAVKAPVPLAVSLLTDRDGRINLDIPLSGSLDDPEFKIWPLVWQVLVNLMSKAATSPFSLLSAITGGGEEMSFVECRYGSDRPEEAELKKISALSKALYNRPNLKIDIEGHVDPTADRQALKKAEFERLLKVQKMKELINKGQDSVTLAEIAISPSEYEKYLTLAYQAADISKPRTALGFAKSLPPADMEKLLQNAIVISDNDLAQLAAGRAQRVRELFIKDGQVEAARLFLVQSPSLSPPKKEKVKDSRVEFKIK